MVQQVTEDAAEYERRQVAGESRIMRCAHGQTILMQTKWLILAQRPVFECYGSIDRVHYRFFHFILYSSVGCFRGTTRSNSGAVLRAIFVSRVTNPDGLFRAVGQIA